MSEPIPERLQRVFDWIQSTPEQRENALNQAERVLSGKRRTKAAAEYVYIIQCQDYVKIGISFDPYCRLALMQTGNPVELRIIKVWKCNKARECELNLHIKYSRYTVRGEWFRLPRIEFDRLLAIEDLTQLSVVE